MNNGYQFRYLLKLNRKRKWIRSKNRPVIPNVIQTKYPYRYENSIQRQLKKHFSLLTQVFLVWWKDRSPAWKIEWEKYHSKIKLDGWDSEVEFFLRSLDEETVISISSLQSSMDTMAEAILAFAIEDMSKQLMKFLSESFYGGTEWWNTVKKEWLATVQKRVSSSLGDYTHAIRKFVYKSVQNDLEFSAILEGIQNINKQLTVSRAQFLASDLVGTLHSTIMKHMHQSIGIEHYLWQTQADERVRGRPTGLYPNSIPSHWVMEGVLCSWNDPTIYSKDNGKTWYSRTALMPRVHPGMAYRCRCVPRPYLVDTIDSIDRQIQGEL
jgi:hypothetical protein